MKKPALLTLFFVVLIDLIGFGLIIPLLPFFATHFGAGGLEIGLIIGAFSLMQFLFAPVWGKLSDRVGRRPIILISLAGSVLSYVLLGLSSALWLVFLSRLLAGICGANISVANAYIADVTTKENRSKGMALLGIAFGLGFILGPVLSALLAHHSLHAPAWTAAILCGANLIAAWFFLPESLTPSVARTGEPRRASYFSDWLYVLKMPVIGLLVAVAFLTNLAIAQWESVFGLFIQTAPQLGYGLQTFGYLLAWLGFMTVLLQGGLVGRLVKIFGEAFLLRAGLIILAVSLGLIPFCQGLGSILGALTLLGIGFGLTRPVISGTASLLAGADEQGLVLGIVQGAASLARIIGPLLGGWLYDRALGLPFWTAAGIVLIGWIIARRIHLPRGKI